MADVQILFELWILFQLFHRCQGGCLIRAKYFVHFKVVRLFPTPNVSFHEPNVYNNDEIIFLKNKTLAEERNVW